jgi:hypothetical protein
MEQKPIQVQANGLVCDNENCDYRKDDIAMQDYGAWIGALCPDCGEPLLTQQQYDLMQDVLHIVNSLNEMADDPFMAALMSKIDSDMGHRQASLSIKASSEGGLEVGEIEWLDN